MTDKFFKQTIRSFSPIVQSRLAELRRLILQTAASTHGVGPITEALRWGQYSFLTMETGSGSTIRIDGRKADPDAVVVYFHCQSGLVDQFKEIYPSKFVFEGQRALILDARKPIPKNEFIHCIALALTHHLRKKGKHNETPDHNRYRPRAG